MSVISRLHYAVKNACPAMVGVSMGATKSEWRVDFLPEATKEQREAAQAAIDAFDLEAETAFAARQEQAKKLLENSDVVVVRSVETGSLSQEWKDYRNALREVVRGNRSDIPPQPPF